VGCSYYGGKVFGETSKANKIQFHAFFIHYPMETNKIANLKILYRDSLSPSEKEIIEQYWKLDESFLFPIKPKTIKDKFDLTSKELRDLIAQNSKLEFYIFCPSCESYEQNIVSSQTGFREVLSYYNSRYRTSKCDYCKQVEREALARERAELRQKEINKYKDAVKNKVWEELSDYDNEVLKSILDRGFDVSYSYYGKDGKPGILKFIKSLRLLSSLNLLLLKYNFRNYICDVEYLPQLEDVYDYEPKPLKKLETVILNDEIRMLLPKAQESNHPNAPKFSGTVNFQEEIIIQSNMNYIFGMWQRANGDFYLTLIPEERLEAYPQIKRLSSYPKHIHEIMQDYLNSMGEGF